MDRHPIEGKTYRIESPVGTAFITINGSEPIEMFVNVGKAGSHIQADAEAIGRLVSLFLQSECNSTERERARLIIGQLKDIGGAGLAGFGNQAIYSLADAIARALAIHIGEWDDSPQP